MDPIVTGNAIQLSQIFRGVFFIDSLEQPQVYNELVRTIQDVQDELLPEVLGYSLYKELETAYAGTPDARWAELVEGTEWTNGDTLTKWGGIATFLVSQVYCRWITLHVSRTTAAGEIVTKSDGGQVVNPRYKYVVAWNQGIDALYGLWDLLDYRKTGDAATYPEWVSRDVIRCDYSRMTTLI